MEESQRGAAGPARPGQARPPDGAPPPPADSTAPPPPAPATEPPARRGFNPLSIGRRLFLALTGVEDITMTYNGTQSSSAGGLQAGGYSLIDALYGYGPSLGFRLGTDRRIPINDRLNTDRLQFQDNLTDVHRLDARTQIRLSNDLNVNLTWQVNWNAGESFSFVPGPNGLDPRPGTLNGASEATVLALGGTYQRLLDAQFGRLERDRNAAPDSTGRIPSGVLSTTGVTDDFRAAFARGMGSFGPNALFALPMPNWDVTYSGLGRWPLFRSLTQQVQIRHGYSATYRVGYQSDALGGQISPVDLSIPGSSPLRFYFSRPDLSPTTVTVNERFQPLIGLNVTWRGGIQTELAWNKSQNVALAAAAARVDESDTEEASLRVSYARSGLRLPFLGRRRLNNNLRFTLTLSRTSTNDQALLLRQDLLSLLSGTDLQRQATGVIRLAAEPRLSYTISNQVSVDLFLRYAATEGRNSQIPSSSQVDGGVSFRVSFSN
jgi:cell surface protein SprA